MRGSVFLEVTFTLLGLVIPMIAFQCEVIRLSQYHALLHYTAFHFVRAQAIGKSFPDSRKRAVEKVADGLGGREKKVWARTADFETGGSEDSIWGSVRIRFPSLFPIFQDRFQVTKKCPFSTSFSGSP